MGLQMVTCHIVASELKDPICHSNECQIGSFSSEATTCWCYNRARSNILYGHVSCFWLVNMGFLANNIDEIQVIFFSGQPTENWAPAAVANDDTLVEKSVTKANLTRRTRLVQIDIKNHIWPRRQIKGPRGIERESSHRFQFGWWCQLIRHVPWAWLRSLIFTKIHCFVRTT